MEQDKVVITTCNSHCGGQCPLRVHVKEGVITRIEADDGKEPQVRACFRGRAYRQRVYAPDRLKYPMKRVGSRGDGKFERISWEEAFDITAGELNRIIDTHGPGSIILSMGGGDIDYLHRPLIISRLLAMAGGYSKTWGFISYEGSIFATMAMYGTLFTRNSRDDLLNSRLIILWAENPVSTIHDTNTCWFLSQAREKGIKIISVDPRYTDTTALYADQWIPIRPGTDAAMLIAMAYVMIEEGLQDQAFLDKYTVGFDTFKDYVTGVADGIPKTPQWAEAISGVPAVTIADLARVYATTKPAALVSGIAPGRTAYGEQYHRATITLAAMTGNIGVKGGEAAGRFWTGIAGYPFMKIGQVPPLAINPIEEGVPPRKYGLATGFFGQGRVNTSQISDAILKGRAGGYPYDYKAVYITNTNYVNQAPNINKTVEAFKKLEFVVVQEQFMTATAKYADIIFPICTFFERNDITVGEGIPFYGYINKVIEPLHESKNHLDIGVELAKRMGIPDFSDKTEEEWLREIVKGSIVPDYDEFKRTGIYWPEHTESYVAFRKEIEDPENNPFPTPSGKIEIYSQRIADMDHPKIPPIPKYIETWESRNDPLAKKYPLQLVTSHFKRRAHSQYETMPWLQELQTQRISINTEDARTRSIESGNMVRVFNDRGQTTIQAEVTERILPGVVDIPQGAWYDPDENNMDRAGSANVLTSDEISPGGAVPYNTNLVQVEKISL